MHEGGGEGVGIGAKFEYGWFGSELPAILVSSRWLLAGERGRKGDGESGLARSASKERKGVVGPQTRQWKHL